MTEPSLETLPRCSRCGRRDAEPPDGFAVFASRNLFGPKVDRTLCARCFSIRTWQAWRLLVVGIALVVAVIAALDGDWIAPLGAAAAGGVWWWIAGVRLKALAEEGDPVARG